jgi:pyridoxal phosphate-dependent aminotransferase EpsN
MSKPRIYLSSPHMGGDELALVQEAFATNWIAPLGPHVDAFEREFATKVGAAHAAALSSGTAALHLALRLCGVQRDDDVMVSTLTFSASVNPIVYEGARPVFIDSDRTSWNLDPNLLAEALADRARRGRLPKALILVHLYGQCADLDAVADLCAQHGVTLIEDAAEALGATYYGRQTSAARGREADAPPPLLRSYGAASGEQIADGGHLGADQGPALRSGAGSIAIAPGTRGRLGIYSFNGNKIITTSGGGMLVSAEADLIDKARFLATQARDPAPHYQHSQIGFNYRMSNVLAAIGRGQLRVLDERVNARRANCARYQAALGDLPGLDFMPEAVFGRCNRWLTCITIDPAVAGTDREAVREALAAENIEARPVWKPMHRQPVFADCDVYGGTVAEELFDRGLCLPSGSNLTPADLDRVIAEVRKLWSRG